MRSYWLPERKAISSARWEEERPPAFHCRIVREAWICLRVGGELWIGCELVGVGGERGRVKAEGG